MPKFPKHNRHSRYINASSESPKTGGAGRRNRHVAGITSSYSNRLSRAIEGNQSFLPYLPAQQRTTFSQFSPVYAPQLGADDVLIPYDLVHLRELYRYFYEFDEHVGQAIDTHAEIPLSKYVLLPPRAETQHGKDVSAVAMKKFQEMDKRLNLFEKMIDMAREYWLIGEAFPYLEYDEVSKTWDNMIILDPDFIDVVQVGIGGEREISLKPNDEDVVTILRRQRPGGFDYSQQVHLEDIIDQLDPELILELEETGKILLNQDPSQGSFVYQFIHRQSPKKARGSSMLNRVIRTLMYRDQLRSVQSMITQRNLANIHLVAAEVGDTGLDDFKFDSLQSQVDLALNTPDFAIVTDFPVTWQVINGSDRIIDLTAEYEETAERMMVGLGVTPELMKGEGLYSSGRISIEIMNIRYQLFIARLKHYIEEFVFKPIAIVNDFSEIRQKKIGDNVVTYKEYLYPKVSFSRTTIFDSESVFEMLWNMYIKGSLSIRTIMDVVSLDYDIEMDKLNRDLFTPADANFNEFMTGFMQSANTEVIEKTNVLEVFVKKLRMAGIPIELVEQEAGLEDFGGGGGFDEAPTGIGGPSAPPPGMGGGGFEEAPDMLTEEPSPGGLEAPPAAPVETPVEAPPAGEEARRVIQDGDKVQLTAPGPLPKKFRIQIPDTEPDPDISEFEDV